MERFNQQHILWFNFEDFKKNIKIWREALKHLQLGIYMKWNKLKCALLFTRKHPEHHWYNFCSTQEHWIIFSFYEVLLRGQNADRIQVYTLESSQEDFIYESLDLSAKTAANVSAHLLSKWISTTAENTRLPMLFSPRLTFPNVYPKEDPQHEKCLLFSLQ